MSKKDQSSPNASGGTDGDDVLSLISNADIPYEEDLQKNPFSLRSWLRYIQHNNLKKATHEGTLNKLKSTFSLYERALLELPHSYKLWKEYLDERALHHTIFDEMANLYERCLLFLYKMPRIWIDYVSLLVSHKKIITTRGVFNRALCSLPPSQHDRLWDLVKKDFFSMPGVPLLTVSHLYKRHVQLFPSEMENYLSFLEKHEFNDQAASVIISTLNDPKLLSLNVQLDDQRSGFIQDYWKRLVSLIAELKEDPEVSSSSSSPSSDSVSCIWPVEMIIKEGISNGRLHSDLGWVWSCLAQYFIRKGLLDKARDIYMEGIKSVKSAKDFGQAFDAYAKFEEMVVSKALSKLDLARSAGKKKSSKKSVKTQNIEDLTVDVDLKLARFEHLMTQRPILLNDVMLRANPHSVAEWMTRVELLSLDPEKKINVYMEALSTISPGKASERPLCDLWIAFAKEFYPKNTGEAAHSKSKEGDCEQAILVFEKAVLVGFKSASELVDVWLEYANFVENVKNANAESKGSGVDEALDLLIRATNPVKGVRISFSDEKEPVQARMCKSLKLWLAILSLEKKSGAHDRIVSVYERILELRIATLQVVFDYSDYLQCGRDENKDNVDRMEASFKIYERSIELFGFPVAFDIWNVYLMKFESLYSARGLKIERARELYEQAIFGCPPEYAKLLYIKYALFEEQCGLVRTAMKIFDRALDVAPIKDLVDIYTVYLAKAMQHFGLLSLREIYEKAIKQLPDMQAKDMCLKYAEMETRLGEAERARVVFAFGSQFANPKLIPSYWKAWYDFETAHGSEDTFREMLRIKRSIQSQYQSDVAFVAASQSTHHANASSDNNATDN